MITPSPATAADEAKSPSLAGASSSSSPSSLSLKSSLEILLPDEVWLRILIIYRKKEYCPEAARELFRLAQISLQLRKVVFTSHKLWNVLLQRGLNFEADEPPCILAGKMFKEGIFKCLDPVVISLGIREITLGELIVSSRDIGVILANCKRLKVLDLENSIFQDGIVELNNEIQSRFLGTGRGQGDALKLESLTLPLSLFSSDSSVTERNHFLSHMNSICDGDSLDLLPKPCEFCRRIMQNVCCESCWETECKGCAESWVSAESWVTCHQFDCYRGTCNDHFPLLTYSCDTCWYDYCSSCIRRCHVCKSFRCEDCHLRYEYPNPIRCIQTHCDSCVKLMSDCTPSTCSICLTEREEMEPCPKFCLNCHHESKNYLFCKSGGGEGGRDCIKKHLATCNHRKCTCSEEELAERKMRKEELERKQTLGEVGGRDLPDSE